MRNAIDTQEINVNQRTKGYNFYSPTEGLRIEHIGDPNTKILLKFNKVNSDITKDWVTLTEGQVIEQSGNFCSIWAVLSVKTDEIIKRTAIFESKYRLEVFFKDKN